jgi:hypothetical protein
MIRICLLALFFSATPFAWSAAAVQKEYVILSGGPSLIAWEKFKEVPHDKWWGNFIRTARVRIEEIRKEAGPDVPITWLVYKDGYVKRGKQEGRDLLPLIESVRDKFNLHLVLFDKGQEVIDYLNAGQPRDQVKIGDFEYFGHSNRACFLFDYSNEIDSASKCWLHQNDFTKLKRGIFAKDAFVKSWGCHTGEEMSQKFRSATGIKMWGAVGKTDYSQGYIVQLATPQDRWAY